MLHVSTLFDCLLSIWVELVAMWTIPIEAVERPTTRDGADAWTMQRSVDPYQLGVGPGMREVCLRSRTFKQ